MEVGFALISGSSTGSASNPSLQNHLKNMKLLLLLKICFKMLPGGEMGNLTASSQYANSLHSQ
jgi:hypothetical protein